MKPSEELIYRKFQEKYEMATIEQKQKIDWLRHDALIEDYQLKIIKKTRKKLKDGDIFVLTLDGKNYFYGKVLKANLKDCIYESYNGLNFIVIFKKHVNRINIKDFKEDYNDILINPCLVPKIYWNLGYFYTIGNSYIENEDEQIDYGLWSHRHNSFIKLDGSPINHLPKYLDSYSMKTDIFVALELQEKIILDPSILEDYNLEIREYRQPSKILTEFDIQISPFKFFVEYDRTYITLEIKTYLNDLFKKYNKEMNGYNWEKIMKMYRKEFYPQFSRKIRFDSEAKMLVAYCKNEEILKEFIINFKSFCKNENIEKYIVKLKD